MKNSLFKRACAAAVAVPVALAQCLTIANAVEVAEAPTAGAAQTLTAKSLVSVPAEDDYVLVAEGTYEKVSDWNVQLYGLLTQIQSGSIDPSKIIDEAVKRAGSYSEIAQAAAEKISAVKYTKDARGNITVTVDVDNIAPAFESIAQKYVDEAVKDVVVEYDEQQEAIDEIKNTKFFDGIDISGKVKIVISTADLALGTSVTAEYSFIAGGKEYKGAAAVAYAEEQVAALKESANGALKKIVDKYNLSDEELDKKIRESKEFQEIVDKYSAPITLSGEEVTAAARASEDYKNKVAEIVALGATEEEAKAQIEESDTFKELIEKYSQVNIELTKEEVEAAILKSDDYAQKAAEVKAEYAEKVADMKDKLAKAEANFNSTIDGATAKLTSAKNYVTKAETYSLDKTYADSAALLKAAANNKDKAPAFIANKIKNVPSSFEEAASKNIVAKIFSEIVNQAAAKSPVAIDFSAAQVGAYADKFENIKVNVADLDSTISATYADVDAAAVAEYFKANYNASSVESWMEVEAEADLTNAEAGKATVDFQLKRVVVIETAPETTTSTTATTTTATTTTATEAETTTATTTATEAETTTATTTTATEAETTTATTTTATEAETTTATTTTATEAETTTATTTTATEAETTTTTEAETTTATITTEAETTTTTTATTVEVALDKEFTCTADAGFYLNTDEKYDLDQVKDVYVKVERKILTRGEDGAVISAENDGVEKIDLIGKFGFGEAKPSDKVEADIMTARQIALIATEDITDSKGNVVITKGTELGTVTIAAYVGVKGDINLDGAADSKDASRVLAIYADLSTGVNKAEYKFSNSEIVPGADSVLDDFAAFLADVNNEDADNNHLVGKTNRALDSKDASMILAFYSEASTAPSGSDYRVFWDKILSVVKN